MNLAAKCGGWVRTASGGWRPRPGARGRDMSDQIRIIATPDAPPALGVVGVLVAAGLPGAPNRPLAVIDAQAVLGREDDCDIVLTSGRVSRRHARIFAEEGRFAVEDLGS